MKIRESLPIPFYEFECDTTLIDQAYSEVSQLDFQDCMALNYYNQDLISWFESCVGQVQDIYFHDGIDLTINECWATKVKRMQHLDFHFHMNSILSGVLYLSDGVAGKTRFRIPNPYYSAEHAHVMTLSKSSKEDSFFNIWAQAIQFDIQPKKGTLIIFPSSIEHKTMTHTENFVRHSISFNTFPSGIISGDRTKQLNIKTIKN